MNLPCVRYKFLRDAVMAHNDTLWPITNDIMAAG